MCGGGIRSSVICETLVCGSVSVARQPPRWGGRLRPVCSEEHRRPPWVGGSPRSRSLRWPHETLSSLCPGPIASSQRSELPEDGRGAPAPGQAGWQRKGTEGTKGKTASAETGVALGEVPTPAFRISLWHYFNHAELHGSSYTREHISERTNSFFNIPALLGDKLEGNQNVNVQALLGLRPFCPGDSSSRGGAGPPRRTPPLWPAWLTVCACSLWPAVPATFQHGNQDPSSC